MLPRFHLRYAVGRTGALTPGAEDVSRYGSMKCSLHIAILLSAAVSWEEVCMGRLSSKESRQRRACVRRTTPVSRTYAFWGIKTLIFSGVSASP